MGAGLMFESIGHSFRLMRVGFTLIRYDALIPREYQERMPAGVRYIGHITRFPEASNNALNGKWTVTRNSVP